MSFQSTVYLQQGFGIPGELFDDAPYKAEPFIINSTDADNNVFGRCFTITSEGNAEAGGTGVFGGFLVNPKGSAAFGTAGDPLAASLTLPNYAQGELLTMGSIIVTLPGAAAIGDLVVFDNTSGELDTIAPGADLPVGNTFAQAKVDRFTVSGAGNAVITVNPMWEIPQLA